MPDSTIKKLKGLKEDEERVYYVLLGKESMVHSETKIYFRNQEDAISFYKIVCNTNPISINTEQIYSWDFKNIEDELDRAKLRFSWIEKGLSALLGSEVIKAYSTEKEAREALRVKRTELEKLNKERGLKKK